MTQNHIHSVCPLLIELPPVSGLTGQMLTHVASHSRGQVELNKGISLGWVPHLSVCPARISPSTLPGFPPPPPCVDKYECPRSQGGSDHSIGGEATSTEPVSTSFLTTCASECACKVWSCLSKFSSTLDTRGGKSSWYKGEGPVYGISLGYPYQSCQREWASEIPELLVKCAYICLLTLREN